MLDYGVYYEFIPLENIDDELPTTLNLSQIKIATDYALVITTNSGLWRYVIGDTFSLHKKTHIGL